MCSSIFIQKTRILHPKLFTDNKYPCTQNSNDICIDCCGGLLDFVVIDVPSFWFLCIDGSLSHPGFGAEQKIHAPQVRVGFDIFGASGYSLRPHSGTVSKQWRESLLETESIFEIIFVSIEEPKHPIRHKYTIQAIIAIRNHTSGTPEIFECGLKFSWIM